MGIAVIPRLLTACCGRTRSESWGIYGPIPDSGLSRFTSSPTYGLWEGKGESGPESGRSPGLALLSPCCFAQSHLCPRAGVEQNRLVPNRNFHIPLASDSPVQTHHSVHPP